MAYENIIWQGYNRAYGLHCKVLARLAGNFSVITTDTDANEVLPSVAFFPASNLAIDHAHRILGDELVSGQWVPMFESRRSR